MVDILLWTWEFTKEASPWLLLGFLFAGLLKAFVPSELILRYLGQRNLRSILTATLIGIPLPLCSCGVIPTGIALCKSGVSRASTLAFFISAPATNITAILIALGMLGWKFTIAMILTCSGVALLTGLLSFFMIKERINQTQTKVEKESHKFNLGVFLSRKDALKERLRFSFRYGFIDMVEDIGLYVILGLIIAGVVAAITPGEVIERYLGSGIIGLVLIVLIGIPMYICSTGSIPFVAALIAKGMNPYLGLVFLIVGPATNMSTILAIVKSMGRGTALLYVSSVATISILIAYSFGMVGWI